MKKNFCCGVCGNKKIVKLTTFKNFPLTGIFIRKRNLKVPKNNLIIGYCSRCYHIQLKKFVDKKILYNSKYSTRTSNSHLSKQAYNFLKNFILKSLKTKNFGKIVEIGCNDVTMLKKFSKNAVFALGIDPIWINKKYKNSKKFKVIGKYIENIDFKKDINFSPDIIFSTHNLEHIENPRKSLLNFTKNLDEKSKIFIEIPEASLMIKNLRYDQIFHQHYHYFTLSSLKNLANQIGYSVSKTSLNKKYWGGSIIVMLKKKISKKKIIKKDKYLIKLFKKNLIKFKKKYKKLSIKINDNNKKIIGYGAGQMTQSLAYHLKSRFDNLNYILDDNRSRHNLYYPELNPKIKFNNKKMKSNETYLITALDGAKSIKNKLIQNKIKKIINPLEQTN